VREALLAFLLEEVGADDLQRRPRGHQAEETQAHQRHMKRERQGGVLLASSGLVA
jgi:hypothetical protein